MNLATTLAVKRQDACPHTSRVVIGTHGIERQICESCGHVSFAFRGGELSDVDRIFFTEQPHAAGILEAIEHYDFFGACKVPE